VPGLRNTATKAWWLSASTRRNFRFEGDIDNVRKQAKALGVELPNRGRQQLRGLAAFDNNYWPAIYLADAQGRIRAHHFGEGAYEMSEMILQQLLAEAGFRRIAR